VLLQLPQGLCGLEVVATGCKGLPEAGPWPTLRPKGAWAAIWDTDWSLNNPVPIHRGESLCPMVLPNAVQGCPPSGSSSGLQGGKKKLNTGLGLEKPQRFALSYLLVFLFTHSLPWDNSMQWTEPHI
jgi:hypothetical protein